MDPVNDWCRSEQSDGSSFFFLFFYSAFFNIVIWGVFPTFLLISQAIFFLSRMDYKH